MRTPGVIVGVVVVLLGASACYTGAARPATAASVAAEPGWQLVSGVPFVAQRSERDCGGAAAAMVLGYWSVPAGPDEVMAVTDQSGRGARAGALRDFIRGKGLDAYLVAGDLRDLAAEVERRRPVLVGLAQPYGNRSLTHYVVVVGVNRARRQLATLDPAHGWRRVSFEGFAREWIPVGRPTLVVFPRQAAVAAPAAPGAAGENRAVSITK
jgi:ABC-type bacteriocin/lantibiotic exporter with double-glycine peptidase domain